MACGPSVMLLHLNVFSAVVSTSPGDVVGRVGPPVPARSSRYRLLFQPTQSRPLTTSAVAEVSVPAGAFQIFVPAPVSTPDQMPSVATTYQRVPELASASAVPAEPVVMATLAASVTLNRLLPSSMNAESTLEASTYPRMRVNRLPTVFLRSGCRSSDAWPEVHTSTPRLSS